MELNAIDHNCLCVLRMYSVFLIYLEFKEKSTEKKPLKVKPYPNNSSGKIFLLVGRFEGPWIML